MFKSRFGFRLRASGHNAIAAQTAGISANRMILTALLLSGAIAGLVGMPFLLSEGYSLRSDAALTGIGFTGIAVALLGRNHPVGIVLGALLYGFLDAVAGPLQLEGIPQSIIRVIQADHPADGRDRQRGGREVASPAVPPSAPPPRSPSRADAGDGGGMSGGDLAEQRPPDGTEARRSSVVEPARRAVPHVHRRRHRCS